MQPQSSSFFLGTKMFPGADRGLQSAGRQDRAAFHMKKDRRVSFKIERNKLADEEDDDKNNHTDEDNHLHVLPPELPSHLL